MGSSCSKCADVQPEPQPVAKSYEVSAKAVKSHQNVSATSRKTLQKALPMLEFTDDPKALQRQWSETLEVVGKTCRWVHDHLSNLPEDLLAKAQDTMQKYAVTAKIVHVVAKVGEQAPLIGFVFAAVGILCDHAAARLKERAEQKKKLQFEVHRIHLTIRYTMRLFADSSYEIATSSTLLHNFPNVIKEFHDGLKTLKKDDQDSYAKTSEKLERISNELQQVVQSEVLGLCIHTYDIVAHVHEGMVTANRAIEAIDKKMDDQKVFLQDEFALQRQERKDAAEAQEKERKALEEARLALEKERHMKEAAEKRQRFEQAEKEERERKAVAERLHAEELSVLRRPDQAPVAPRNAKVSLTVIPYPESPPRVAPTTKEGTLTPVTPQRQVGSKSSTPLKRLKPGTKWHIESPDKASHCSTLSKYTDAEFQEWSSICTATLKLTKVDETQIDALALCRNCVNNTVPLLTP